MSLIEAFSGTVTEYFKDYEPCEKCFGYIHEKNAEHLTKDYTTVSKTYRGTSVFEIEGVRYFRTSKAMVQWYVYHRKES